MKDTLVKFIILSFLSLFAFNLSGQITKTKFFVQYDASCDLFRCKLMIDEGAATDQRFSRLVIGSQYSIVAKSGLEIEIFENHNPKISETNKAQNWAINTVNLAPTAQPESDFYSITNGVTPPSFLAEVKTGDTILLFDIKVKSGEYCPADVRAFETGKDPDKTAPGMGSQNYNCSFIILSSGDTYNGNMPSNYYNQSEVKVFCALECVTLSPYKKGLAEPVEVKWGDGINSATREFCPSQDTMIKVILVDANNTAYEKTYELNFTDFKIEENINICPTDSVTLPQLTKTGEWITKDKFIADRKQFSNLIVPKSLGTCQFVYSDCSNPCIDNKIVTVNVLGENDPNCIISSTFEGQLEQFRYFPNPTSGYVQVESKNKCTISLIDNVGREIYKNVALSGKLTLSTEHLSSGMYYIIVQNEHNQERYPLIKI